MPGAARNPRERVASHPSDASSRSARALAAFDPRPAGPRALLLAAAILAATFAAYAPALRAGFIWDDDTFLTANPLIRAADGLGRFWWSTEPPDYFPLTSSMLWIEWRLWRGDPAGFHAVNVLLHGLSSI